MVHKYSNIIEEDDTFVKRNVATIILTFESRLNYKEPTRIDPKNSTPIF